MTNKNNYFQIFGLPTSYKLDESLLTENYLKKQRELCCFADENFANGETLADLNTAYKVLLDPIDRAEYFLKIHGISPLKDQLPMDFAEEIFEIRQKYSLLENDAEKSEEKTAFIAALKKRRADIIYSLQNLENDIEKFRSYVGLLRFTDSFLAKIDSSAYDDAVYI